MQVCCHYRNTTFCICAFHSLNCASVNAIFSFLSFVTNGRLISQTHKALCDLCAKIRIFQNHTNTFLKVRLFLRVHQCVRQTSKQHSFSTWYQTKTWPLTWSKPPWHWSPPQGPHSHFFLLRSCACAHVDVPACAVAYDPLISALSCTASRDTLTPTSTELWPHTFLPWALLTPSLRPSRSSRPASPSPSSLSFFCVSTDVWNYSGMEGWIPPWWAEQRREPFVQ